MLRRKTKKRGPGRPKLPASKRKKPDNKRIYKKFHSSTAAKKKRSQRNTDRRRAGLKVGDKRELHHTKSGKKKIVSRKYNRSRPEGSRVKGSKRNKKRWGKK